ncbi:plasma membrane localization protein, partial [Ascosphaera aggregata]
NVIVTLHILQALIEKCPADLPLYADSVLTILDSVLRSNDLNLVEESIGPFSAFCKFQDPNLLAAEHAFVNHYRNVVRTYASFASDDPASARSASNATATVATASRNSPSLSVLLRWKTAGLRAIQAVVSIDDLGTDVMNQLDIVLPPLLENIYTYSFANHSAGINEKNNRNQSDINHARIQALEEAEREISSSRHRGSLRTIDSQEATDAASYATATAHEEAQHADQAIHTLADTTAAATATATAVADAANGNASDDENNSQKAAETAVRALALGCLQRIYATASNTGHIRNATSQILRFIVARQPDWTTGSVITPPYATTESTDAPTWIHSAPPCSLSPAGAGGSAVAGCSWGRHLLAIIARSTPVQNRFIILLAAMESLLNTPMSTRKMPAQLMLASLVDGLLSGPNNLIGLSVMDVLIGLLQHLLLLLRVTAGKTKRVLHRQTTSGFIRYSLTGVDGDGVVRGKQNQGGGVPKRTALKNENDGAQSHQRSRSITLTDEDAISDPERRAELANSLQLCIGHLATHIYYADQVSDIIAMILSRVKPATSIMELSDSSAEADANANADVSAGKDAASSSSPVVTTNGTVSPDHEQERLFAFPESQISALRSVKNVLCVANSRSSPSVGPAGIPTITTSESRNKVPISAWEDTQWMISDTDVGVQIGYIDALVTWLNSETTADDLRVVESRKKALGITAANLHGGGASALNPLTVGAAAARPLTANFSAATSGHGNDTSYCGGNGNPSDSSERLYRTIADTVTAAHRDQVASVASQFLSLLHIAVYDSVSTVSGDGDVAEEQNILRLHLALATLVDKLGVNAIRHGLPMIMRLQDEFVVADQAAATITTEGRCERSISKAARVMAGSLVHGYLLAIVQRFELYSSSVGREITREIERRKNEDCWLCAVSIPPLSLGEIDELGKRQGEKGGWALGVPEIAILHPFTNVGGLADLIEESYNAAAAQSFHPSSLDGTTLARPSTATSTHSKSQQRAYQAHALIQPLPASVRESMTMPWTKESALAAIEANDPNLQSSLSGSRTNTNLGLSTGVGRAYLSEALGHRHGAPSSASVGRLRAGTALSSVDTPSSVNPADDAAARRSVSVRDGRSGQMSGLARRGSMPDEHRLSVGTTYTIRMDELRHALSVSNAESRDKLTAVPKQQRCQSAGHASNLTGRRESSSISSTYSDHPSLVSAHSGLPPTGGVDKDLYHIRWCGKVEGGQI